MATDAKLGVSIYTSLYVNIKIHLFILFEFIAMRECLKCEAGLKCVGVGKRRPLREAASIFQELH